MPNPKGKIKKIQDDQDKHDIVQTPQVVGETSKSGSMVDPESDDNVLDNAHEMGLYEEADEEHPAELGIAEQVEKDERKHQEED